MKPHARTYAHTHGQTDGQTQMDHAVQAITYRVAAPSWTTEMSWYPYTKKNKKLIENIQRRATRMIPELKGLSYTDRLQHLKLFSMDYRRKRGDMIQLFKILNGFENIDAQTMFTFATSQTRGHNKNLYKPRCAKGFRQHSFCIRSIDPWNSLSQSVIDSSTVNEFKNKLDKEWRHIRFNVEEVY